MTEQNARSKSKAVKPKQSARRAKRKQPKSTLPTKLTPGAAILLQQWYEKQHPKSTEEVLIALFKLRWVVQFHPALNRLGNAIEKARKAYINFHYLCAPEEKYEKWRKQEKLDSDSVAYMSKVWQQFLQEVLVSKFVSDEPFGHLARTTDSVHHLVQHNAFCKRLTRELRIFSDGLWTIHFQMHGLIAETAERA